jgi:GntR family transcriptional regulator, transcriptional repressor for pyruvate dehydrogenase complex
MSTPWNDDAPDGGAATTGGEMFRPVSQGRMSEVIVEQIRLLIRQGKLNPGDRLPAERDLCERFKVSRVTVREALRVLEAAGLIEIRVGARGGAFVTAPSSLRVGEGIADLLSMSTLSAAEVTEARLVLELGIIPMVCERAVEQDFQDLREICARALDALGDNDYQLSLSTEFHIRVAQAAHNGAIELLVKSLREALLMSLARAHREVPVGEAGVREHMAFVDAIEARDAAKAGAIMAAHLRRTAQRVGALDAGQGVAIATGQ